MGSRTLVLYVTFSILLLAVLAGAQLIIPVKAEPIITIISGWLTQPVTLDGRITTAEEWSDAIPVDLTLRGEKSGSLIPARVWIKNGHEWLYILMSVEWPADDIDQGDHFKIMYGWRNDSAEIRDEALVAFDGRTGDEYVVKVDEVEQISYEDTNMSPPGENNAEGGASHDGTHYWFEFRKELDSGDGYDWVFVPGQTYGGREGEWIGLLIHDDKWLMHDEKEVYHDEGIMLQLAPVLPSIGIARPEDGAITSVSSVKFTASVSGHLSKVTLVVVGVHDMEFNEETGLYEAMLTLSDGTYKWRVEAEGVLGDVGSMPERTLIVDATEPMVVILSPASGEVIKKNKVDVSWGSGDATSGVVKVEVKLDAFDWVDVTGKTSYTFTKLAEGDHEVMVRATDKAGNVAEKVITFTALPPPPPEISIKSPSAGEIIKGSIIIRADVSSLIDIDRVECYIDDQLKYTETFPLCAWEWDTTIYPDGEHTIKVVAYDIVGNSKLEEIAVTIRNVVEPPMTLIAIGATIGVVFIGALAFILIRRRPPKPPKVKPPEIKPPPKPPTREELLKELEDMYKSGRITETAYKRLKKKYEAEEN